MRVKTQFIISIVTFSLIMMLIGVSIAFTQRQISELDEQESLSEDIQTGASALSYISTNYFLFQENSSIDLWQEEVEILSHKLSSLNTSEPYQQELVKVVNNDLEHIDVVFEGFVAFLENSPRNISVRIQPSFQTQWNRMTAQEQALAFDSHQLSEFIREKTNQANLTNIFLMISFLGLFGAYLVTGYLIFYRMTLRSISTLQEGIKVIGSGKLDFPIVAGNEDEISDISASINQMALNLKTVTSSKRELELEMEERKKVEKKVEEYQRDLENLVEQRTKQLKDSERLAAIGATAGMVGHDIRNPLQSILGDIFLAKEELKQMSDGEGKQTVQESLEEIEKNVDYINKIVADLQDFSRPITPAIEVTDLEAIIEDVMIKRAIPSNVVARWRVERNAIMIFADPALLKRILSNLINNAVQAMPDGGKLDLSAQREAGDIVITVKDTGVGIPEDIKPRLFTPLFTTKSKGQGFGLAVVKRMTEALGGTVTFEDSQDKGTTFKIRLPSEKKS